MKIKPCINRPLLNPCTLEGRNYQVDPYIGCEHYCYYCYALNQAETDWSKEVLIHEGIASRLESELAGILPQTIYMGWQTDPYQPCEAKYRQTRQVLELLLEKGFSASILTKSDLVLRDSDILQKMNAANVSVSVAFNDNRTRCLFEANTMDTEKRIEALHQMKAAGVRTGALICPVIPYITDAIQFSSLNAWVRRASATACWRETATTATTASRRAITAFRVMASSIESQSTGSEPYQTAVKFVLDEYTSLRDACPLPKTSTWRTSWRGWIIGTRRLPQDNWPSVPQPVRLYSIRIPPACCKLV